MSGPADAAVYLLTKRPMPSVIVRAATSQLAIQALRNATQDVMPGGLDAVDTVQTHIDRDLRLQRLTTFSGSLCAVLISAILEIGFFGILSLQVAERRREIGVRIALGADLARVSALLLKKLSVAITAGLALGSAAAFVAAARIAEIYHLSLLLVIAGYASSLVLLAFMTLLAAVGPLRRALAVSPTECLTAE